MTDASIAFLNLQADEDANIAGYEANFEGVLLRDNPHPAGSRLFAAWDAGHLQAQSVRDELEADTYERCRRYA